MSSAAEQERVLKTIESSTFANGGQLQPKQQNKFIRIIRGLPGLLSAARFERVNQKKSELDILNIGEPITETAEENDNSATPAQVKTGKLEYNTKKIKSSWNLTTETLLENIERGNFENTIMESMTQRIGTDLELLGLQGDRLTYAGVNTPYGRLLRRLNGYDVQTQNVHIVDCGGSTIVKEIFAEMIRALPEQYQGDPNLRWIMSRVISVDWMDVNSNRGTALGDRALEGKAPAPYGIPIMEIPMIPSRKAISLTTGTAAIVIGNRQDMFQITGGVNDKLTIAVNGAAAVTVTLAPGLQYASQIAARINETAGLSGIASDDGNGRLVLTSPTVGAASSIDIQNVANNAYTELGLTVATTTGAAVGAAGSVPEGSFIWLANPRNFWWVMLNQTRIYNWFNKDYDRFEFVVYNEVDYGVENRDAIVKATNIRRRSI